MKGPCMCGSPDCGSCGSLLGGPGDDLHCAQCQALLPENPAEESWPYSGLCNAACAARYQLARARWPDDALHRSSRSEMERALEELIRGAT